MTGHSLPELSPSVGVVIVHYRREHDLGLILTDLHDTHAVTYENIVIVNNGGSQSLLETARSRVPAANWLDLNNPGYAAAVNAGAARLLDRRIEYILVVTHDVQIQPGAIERLAEHLSSDSRCGLVGPKLMDSRDGSVWSFGGVQPPPLFRPSNRKKLQERRTGVVESDWLDGACFLIRARDLMTLGGLEESYFLYFEDVDLGWRVRTELGLSVHCVLDAVASQSPGGNLDQYLASRNLQWLLARQRHRLARAAYVAELVLRLVVGTIAKPRGARDRQLKRLRGLRAGFRQPEKVRAQLEGG